MPASVPRDSTLAVVGDGFGSLIVYATAIYLGYRPEEIAIFGTNDNPVGTYQQFAHNLGQTVLRSESESHFLPADWPTFAQLDAWSRRSPAPLYRSIKRKYNPGVPDILAEASVVQRRLGWEHVRVPRRVGWLQREDGPPRHFVLYDEDANFIGRSKHVMMALGHGPLQFPPVLAKAKAADPEIDAADRPGLRAEAVPPVGPLHRHRRRHRLDQRVGQRARRRRQGDRAAPQPGAGRAGPQRAALPVRGARHRHLPGPRVRGPDRVPRPGAQGHRAEAPLVARADRERPRRGPLRRADRRDRPGRARAGRACACTSAAATARTRAGSTSPASAPAPGS